MTDDLVKRLRRSDIIPTVATTDAAADEIERLRAALEPFAIYSSPYIEDPTVPAHGMPANTPHTAGDYRRARAALSPPAKEV